MLFYIYLLMYILFFGNIFTSCLGYDKQGDVGDSQKKKGRKKERNPIIIRSYQIKHRIQQ